jgi:hypothetical protein
VKGVGVRAGSETWTWVWYWYCSGCLVAGPLVVLEVAGLVVVQPVVVSGQGTRVLRTILRLSFGDRVVLLVGHLNLGSCRSCVVAGAKNDKEY